MGGNFFLIGCCAGFDRYSAGYPNARTVGAHGTAALARDRQCTASGRVCYRFRGRVNVQGP